MDSVSRQAREARRSGPRQAREPRRLRRRIRRHAALWCVVPLLVAMGVAGVTSPAQAQSSLREAAGNMLVGAAVTPDLLNNSTYANIVATEFSSVTAENHMKWDTVEPSQGQFNFGPGDQIVQFAQQNNQHVYGHTLVWHSQTPQWVENLSGSAMDQAMQNHITEVMQQWPNIGRWDVANEVIDDNAQLRDSFWLQGMGEGYIAQAFEYANAADPDATLCLNDYSIDGINAKSDAYFNLVQDLLAQGVPIDCMGFQAHLILGQVPGNMQQNLQRFANLGLEVWITELDIRIPDPVSQQDWQQQANEFAQVFEICQNVNGCAGVTTWGVHDAQSWVDDTFPEFDDPLMWDDNLQPKPAYNAVLEQLGGDPGPGPSPTASPTDPGPGPGPGGCQVSPTVQNEWNSGYVVQPVTVSNTGTSSIGGWTVTFTLPAGHSVAGSWNADFSVSGQTVTATNASYNGTLSGGGSTSFGFQVSKPDGDSQTPSNYSCSAN